MRRGGRCRRRFAIWIEMDGWTWWWCSTWRTRRRCSGGIPQANMGIAIADLSGNGLIDAYVTHLTEELNVLWEQEAPGVFEDKTVAFGLASPNWRGTGFGTVFADFDNDGHPDLALVN